MLQKNGYLIGLIVLIPLMCIFLLCYAILMIVKERRSEWVSLLKPDMFGLQSYPMWIASHINEGLHTTH